MPIFLRISENRLSAATISFEFIVLPFERVISALEEFVLRESTAKSLIIVMLSALDAF